LLKTGTTPKSGVPMVKPKLLPLPEDISQNLRFEKLPPDGGGFFITGMLFVDFCYPFDDYYPLRPFPVLSSL
jgi:hypothetical protein